MSKEYTISHTSNEHRSAYTDLHNALLSHALYLIGKCLLRRAMITHDNSKANSFWQFLVNIISFKQFHQKCIDDKIQWVKYKFKQRCCL